MGENNVSAADVMLDWVNGVIEFGRGRITGFGADVYAKNWISSVFPVSFFV